MHPPEAAGSAAAAGLRRSRLWLLMCLVVLDGLLVAYNIVSALASRERVVEQVRGNAASLAALVQRNLIDHGLRVDAALQGVIDEVERQGSPAGPGRRLDPAMLTRLERRLPEGSTLHVVDATGRSRWPRAWPCASRRPMQPCPRA
ncbi:MAG: hypothetical protein RLY71_3833 [Pseudomonadota bacterium]|jgi:hypothetical protein